MHKYAFAGTAGNHITIRANAYNGSACFDMQVDLYSPAGTDDTTFYGIHSTFVGCSGPTQANIINYTLPTTGTYKIYISEKNGTNTSPYWLSLQCRENVASKATPISCGTFVPSDSIIPLGQINAYTFTGTVGQTIILRANPFSGSACFDMQMDLYNPAGVLDTTALGIHSTFVGCSGETQANLVNYVLKTAGTYTVYISEMSGANTSYYSLNLQCR